jgi:hypothetical protein
MKPSEAIQAIEQSKNQQEAARVYAKMIDYCTSTDDYNVENVNASIMLRWSESGLTRIKQLAWDIHEGRKR